MSNCLHKKPLWIIVKVHHGNADSVHMESYPTFEETIQRINDLKAMTLEDIMYDPIMEENEICYGEGGDCQDNSEYWWNVTFKSGVLVTIDAKLVQTGSK